MHAQPEVGRLIEGTAFRDAIHVAVAPVEALETLAPGWKVTLDGGKARQAVKDEPIVGVVDPFLTVLVRAGDRFWLFIYPGTVTSLRHAWTHPAFQAHPAKPKEGENA